MMKGWKRGKRDRRVGRRVVGWFQMGNVQRDKLEWGGWELTKIRSDQYKWMYGEE